MSPKILRLFKEEAEVDTGANVAPEYPYVFCSSICRSDFFRLPLYRFWCSRMLEVPRHHRKQWEFVYIAQALYERGMLMQAKRGIGFGVGREPLVDLFASFGCNVTATDISPEEAAGAGWIETDQHSATKEALYRGISDSDSFDRLVNFRSVNMNEIPDDLREYDFCYSSCSIEHVGSLSKSFDFLLNSVNVLKPGGVSIHTTEFNLSSDDVTIDSGSTVIWRRQDFLRLRDLLSRDGHTVEPFDFFVGDAKIDHYIDLPPYKESPHLRLRLGKYASTSFGVLIRKSQKSGSESSAGATRI